MDEEWTRKLPDLKLIGGKQDFSDHNPIVAQGIVNEEWGSKPFRLYNMWFNNPEFKKLLISQWKALENLPLHSKLKSLKHPIKQWSKKRYGELDYRIESLSKAHEKIQLMGEERCLNDMERYILKAIFSLLKKLNMRKEQIWRQKARVINLKLKDSNTKFFHTLANIKKRRKQITMLKSGNKRIKGVSNIKKEIESYIKNHFGQKKGPMLLLPPDGFRRISMESGLILERIPTMEEVKNAVWSCGVDKAPGFDGFNFKFYRGMWEEIGEEVFCFVKQFMETGMFPSNLNVTWVTLIPKVRSPVSLKDYRPISLIGKLVQSGCKTAISKT